MELADILAGYARGAGIVLAVWALILLVAVLVSMAAHARSRPPA